MPASVRHHVFTLAEYFTAERHSRERHEFVDGQIFLMAGGSPRHNYLCARLAQLLGSALEGKPCAPLGGDQRIATASGLYTYADGSVFCGPIDLGAEQTATNPTVLVEVLSEGTRAYDRGEKLDSYKSIPSLEHVVLVEQDGTDIEVWSRAGDSWTRSVHVDRKDVMRLPAIEVELSVGQVYEGAEAFPVS